MSKNQSQGARNAINKKSIILFDMPPGKLKGLKKEFRRAVREGETIIIPIKKRKNHNKGGFKQK